MISFNATKTLVIGSHVILFWHQLQMISALNCNLRFEKISRLLIQIPDPSVDISVISLILGFSCPFFRLNLLNLNILAGSGAC